LSLGVRAEAVNVGGKGVSGGGKQASARWRNCSRVREGDRDGQDLLRGVLQISNVAYDGGLVASRWGSGKRSWVAV
jgi:hypothetical protein